MKQLKIYHINFVRTIDTVAWEYTIMSDPDRVKLSRVAFAHTFEYEDNYNNYNMIVITSIEEILKFKNILDNNMIHYLSKDISQNILTNKFDFERVKKQTKTTLLESYEKFLQNVDNWIYDNLDLDIVLDLINEKGLENLREIDKKFLQNYGR